MLSNRKSKDTYKFGLRARHTARRFETSADTLKLTIFRITAGLAAPVFAVAGWLAMTSSSMAVTATYRNEFRICAGRLLSVGIAAQSVSEACAAALRPGDLSACVTRIKQQTQIAASDALVTCRQARRPEDVATCVVGINRYTRQTTNSTVLNYCGQSLLPVRFANCVIGLRAETNVASTQVLETCIDSSDKISGFLPSFIPSNQQSTEFQPTFESTPNPSEPYPTPAVPSQTPLEPSQTPANPSGK